MKRFVLALLTIFVCAHYGFGQDYDVSPLAQTGQLPTGSYDSTAIDSIGIYNGNLSLNIPLLTLPGRELSTGLRLVYNAQKWQQYDYSGNMGGIYTGGWQLSNQIGNMPAFFGASVPEDHCSLDGTEKWWLNATWVDGLGSKRLYIAESDFVPCAAGPPPSAYASRTYLSTNGDNSVLNVGAYDSSTNTYADFSLYLKDGSVINFNDSWSVTTANGNNFATDGHALPFADTLGRSISYSTNYDPTNTSSPYSYYKAYTVTDANGTSQTYTLNYTDRNAINNPWATSGVGVYCGYASNDTIDGQLNSVTLPNSLQYQFTYETCRGLLTKVTLPTGGYIRYDYSQSDPTVAINDFVSNRYVSYDGSTEQDWNYSLAIDTGGRHITVTGPVGDQVVHYFYDDIGEEYKTVWMESGGTVRKTVATCWAVDIEPDSGPYINGHRMYVATSIDGLRQRQSFSYDSNLNVSQIQQTDWYSYSGDFSCTSPDTSGTEIEEQNLTYTTINALPFQKTASAEVKGIDPADSTFKRQKYTTFTYDDFTPIDPCGGCGVQGYSTPSGSRGNLTTVTSSTSSSATVTQTFHYDLFGNVIRKTDERGHDTSICYADNYSNSTNYNSFAFPTTVTAYLAGSASNDCGTASNTLVTQNQYEYNTSLLTSSTDPRGKSASYGYDGMNRMIAMAGPAPGSASGTQYTSYSFSDAVPSIEKDVTVASGTTLRTTSYFDKLYRSTSTVDSDPAGDVHNDVQYDNKGRVSYQSQPYRTGGTPVYTISLYDALDRPTSIANPDGSSVAYSYSGNTVTVTDENSLQRKLTSNSLGQLVEVDEPYPTLSSPMTTTYGYYVFGPLAAVSQSGQTRSFSYDFLGHLLSATEPESGTTYYGYDNTGNLSSRVDARSITTTYSYDFVNRLTGISYSDGTSSIARAYDSSGNNGLLASETDSLGTTTYSYSDAGLVLGETRGFTGVSGSFATGYDYDAAGRLTSITYPSGRVVNRTYQASSGVAANSLNTLVDNATSTTLLSSISANAAAQITARTFGNSVVESRSYNSRNQVTGITALQGTTYLMNMSYAYGASPTDTGRIVSRTDAVQPEQSAQYTFDSIYRLTQAANTAPSWGISYGYDTYGNRTSQTPSGLASTLTGLGSQTLGYTNNRNNALSYDNAGDVTNDGMYAYAFDAEGRMKSAESSAITYSYDAEGRMIKRATSLGATYYIYGQTGLLSEFSTASGVTAAASTDRLEYRISEQTATPVLLMNGSGLVTENNRVLPFGEQWQASSLSTNGEKFTTYEHDPDTGNDYAMMRHYQSQYGRFLSPDALHGVPENSQSWNRYTYGMNDPLNNMDPTGMSCDPSQSGTCARFTDNPGGCDDGRIAGTARPDCGGDGGEETGETEEEGPAGSGPITFSKGPSVPVTPAPPSTPNPNPNNACSVALNAANRSAAGVARANTAWSALQSASNANGIPTALLAAIGVRETNFMNVQERLQGGGLGPGMGIFQLTNQPGVSSAQAFNLPFAANYAAGMLAANRNYLSSAFSFTPAQLLQATAASYNLGKYGISGNPNTIDVGSAGGNYGRTIVGIMACF